QANDAPAPGPTPQPEPAAKPNTVPKIEPKPEMISEPKTPPLRDSEPVMARSAPLLKTVDASPMLRGTIPDTAKPFVPATVRNATAGQQTTTLGRTEDAADLAMPSAPATTGTTAVPARAAETMAKADEIAAPKADTMEAEPTPISAPASDLPAKASSPNVM